MKTVEIQGHVLPIAGYVEVLGNPVPLLNIRMMSDERERELARRKEAAV